MPFEQQHQTARQDTKSDPSITALEVMQKDLLDARRELLRWKMLANQHQERLKEIESSASWRYSAAIRLLPPLRRRWKALLLGAIVALLLLPLSPVIVVALLLPAGRGLLWSLLARVRPLRDLLADIGARLRRTNAPSRGEANQVSPLIYQRPSDDKGRFTEPASDDQRRWHLLQQLSPQRRLLLQRFGLTRAALISDYEMPELLSLSRSEISVLNVIMSEFSIRDQAKV